MDNPAFFTVVRRRQGPGTSSAYGLFSSRDAAGAEAVLLRGRFPEVFHDVAIVTMLDQDPASGTPLGHRAPTNPAGFVLASLSTEHFEHRWLAGPLISTEARAVTFAAECRAGNTSPGTFDVAALTITDHDPAKEVPAP